MSFNKETTDFIIEVIKKNILALKECDPIYIHDVKYIGFNEIDVYRNICDSADYIYEHFKKINYDITIKRTNLHLELYEDLLMLRISCIIITWDYESE